MPYTLRVSLALFIATLTLLFGATFALTTPAHAAGVCDTYRAGIAIPDNYGAAYNVYNTSQMLLTVFCNNDDSVVVTTGKTDGYLTYVYKDGYYYANGAWHLYTYSCTGMLGGAWCPGKVTKTLTGFNTTGFIFLASYNCQWNGSKWNCGCRNTTCATGYWQLQAWEVGGEPISTTVISSLYEPQEITLTANNSYGNPYKEVDLIASITPPSGSGEQSYTIPGFWDGGKTWRVRWAPRSKGEYKIEISSNKNDSGLTKSVSASVSNSATYSNTWAPNGFIQIPKSGNDNYLVTSNGKPFMWVGDTQWIGLYDYGWSRKSSDKPLTDSLWNSLIDARKQSGFNLVQSVLWNSSLEWKDGARPFTTDRTLVNPTSWQRVDKRIVKAVKSGMVMNLLLSSNGYIFDWSEEDRARLQKYIVARYAAYNVMFGGGEEVSLGGYLSSSEAVKFIKNFHTFDPYRKTVGLHNPGFGVVLYPNDVDYLFAQMYGGPDDLTYSVANDVCNKYNKPYVNAETYYFDADGIAVLKDSSGNIIKTRTKLLKKEDVRAIAWRTYLAGCAGYTYGNYLLAVGWDNSTSIFNEDGAKEMTKLVSFFKLSGAEWGTFDKFVNVGSGRYFAAATSKKEYVLANEKSGSYTANLGATPGPSFLVDGTT